jgi:hypothetical protein
VILVENHADPQDSSPYDSIYRRDARIDDALSHR